MLHMHQIWFSRRKNSANTSLSCPVMILNAWIIKLLLLNFSMKKAVVSFSNLLCTGVESIMGSKMHLVKLQTVWDNRLFNFPEEASLFLRVIEYFFCFQNRMYQNSGMMHFLGKKNLNSYIFNLKTGICNSSLVTTVWFQRFILSNFNNNSVNGKLFI